MRRLARTRDSRRNKKTHWGGKMKSEKEISNVDEIEKSYCEINDCQIPTLVSKLAHNILKREHAAEVMQVLSTIKKRT